MSVMRAVIVEEPGAEFKLVQKEIPNPEENEVLIKIEACGICHGDANVKEGRFPRIQYPRIPGHEVIGRVEKKGEKAAGWRLGEKVGVGWYGGPCNKCSACVKGDFINCEHPLITGISFDGGYAEYMTVGIEALVKVPEELDPVQGAPLLCAGRTTFNALKSSNAKPGDLVAILGIGGLGHLAVQYAKKMGFRTVAISRGKEKKALALDLGAYSYIDSDEDNAAEELKKMGGAHLILATAPSGKAISEIIGGMKRGGQLIMVASLKDALQIRGMIPGTIGSFTGGSAADAVSFSVLTEVYPMIEEFPLEEVVRAYEKMLTSKVHFRSVLNMKM